MRPQGRGMILLKIYWSCLPHHHHPLIVGLKASLVWKLPNAQYIPIYPYISLYFQMGHVVFFSRTRFLKKLPPIAKGLGPGPGPAFTHSNILLLGFHRMTRVSSYDWAFIRYNTFIRYIRQVSGRQDIYPMTRHLSNDETFIPIYKTNIPRYNTNILNIGQLYRYIRQVYRNIRQTS